MGRPKESGALPAILSFIAITSIPKPCGKRLKQVGKNDKN